MEQSTDTLTKVEWNVLYIACGMGYAPGDFFRLIIQALFTADSSNFAKLAASFPEYAEAVRAYQFGDLHERAQRQSGVKAS